MIDLESMSEVFVADSQRLAAPDFMIIGAAKAGTTSLYDYLQRHSGVLMSTPKEPEFFSSQEIFSRGRSWYSSLFLGARGRLTGEASTTYSRWPHTQDAPRLIYEITGTKKFIYVLREPVSRAYSHYQHHMRTGVTKTFEQALADDSVYVDCSNYYLQVQRFLRYFDLSCFHFILQVDLQNRPEQVLAEVQRFLGLPNEDLLRRGVSRKNASDSYYYVQARVMRVINSLPGGAFVLGNVPKNLRTLAFSAFRTSPIGASISSRHRVPPMKPGTEALLREYFREPNRHLANLTGVDLSAWGAT